MSEIVDIERFPLTHAYLSALLMFSYGDDGMPASPVIEFYNFVELGDGEPIDAVTFGPTVTLCPTCGGWRQMVRESE